MAKSRKSKILAMALCASVMAGIYATPVMAESKIENTTGNSSIEIGDNGGIKITVAGHHVGDFSIKNNAALFNYYGTISANNLTGIESITFANGNKIAFNAYGELQGDLALTGRVTARSYLTTKAGLVVQGANGYSFVAREDGLAIGNNLRINSTEYNKENANFFVDTATGDVTSKGNVEGTTVKTASGADLDEVNSRTQNMTAESGITNFTGDVAVGGDFSAANNTFKVREGVGETVIAGGVISSKDVFGNVGMLNGSSLSLDSVNLGERTSINAGTAIFEKDGSGTMISGGDITADTLNGKDIDDLVVGADIETDLANIAGISREELPNGTYTTTIEGVTEFDQSGMGIYTDHGYSAISGGQATFMYGDSFTQIIGGEITADKLNGKNINEMFGKLDDVYNRTQGIDYDETTGTTTIDGNLVVEGDATTGAGGDAEIGGNASVGGNLDVAGDVTGANGDFGKVSADEITVGDKTYIDGNSVNSVEGNFEKVSANEATIGETHISQDGTIQTNKVVTGDTVLDNEGLNVGGKTSVTADGVNVGGAEGTSIKHDEISVGDGGYIGGGDVVTGEGVSVNQTAERVGHLENRVGELEDRIDKVGAMAAAIANLRTMGYDPAAPTEVAVGLGQYRDETGAALGLFHYPNRDFMLSLSVSTSGDEVMGGIGATWKFGRKSPEKVAEIKKAQAEADARRAEEAKLAKAEEMKQAAKEAKIKAQQERHAKLAAERAAQAEAAK